MEQIQFRYGEQISFENKSLRSRQGGARMGKVILSAQKKKMLTVITILSSDLLNRLLQLFVFCQFLEV